MNTTAHRELHYRGDISQEIVGQVVGPTLLGQQLTIIAADYDEATDTTTALLCALNLAT